MSGIEPETKEFLKRVLKTVSGGLLFLIFHMIIGIYLNWGFYEKNIQTGNLIYYAVLLSSLFYLIYYYRNLWKGKI
jgi:NADH:ubiquinone oxidoreductase subunit 3 (subunit A)